MIKQNVVFWYIDEVLDDHSVIMTKTQKSVAFNLAQSNKVNGRHLHHQHKPIFRVAEYVCVLRPNYDLRRAHMFLFNYQKEEFRIDYLVERLELNNNQNLFMEVFKEVQETIDKDHYKFQFIKV